jgi:hypothetical protein
MSKLTKDQVVELILTNDRAVERALVVLFQRQTAAEQRSENTQLHNQIGFTHADAPWGTRNARWVMRGGRLNPYQLSQWRKRDRKGTPRLAKYWRQLSEAAQEKAARKLPLAA